MRAPATKAASVTEFGLILAINLAGLTFALLVGRWLVARDAGGPELRRLGGALERASGAFVLRECRLAAVGAISIAIVLFGVHALRARGSGTLEAALWSVLGIGVGAASACLVAWFGARIAAQAAVRTLAAAQRSLDRALSVSARAGGASGFVAETLSALGVVALFGAAYSMKGGFALGEERSAELALRAATLLPGYALGAGIAALVLQRGGASYHAAGDVAADLAGERDAGLEHDDARNPAVVSDLVGDHVGLAATRTVDLFVSATLGNVAAMIVAAGVAAQNREQTGALQIVLLPVVVRAFGVLASFFGLMVVRTDDAHSPAAALYRGHATTAVVSLGGLIGTSYWLLGERLFVRFALGGAIGLLTAVLVMHASRLRVERRFTPLKEVLESLKAGDATAIAHGLGVGLSAAVLPMLLVGAAMAGAFQLGATSGLVSGGLLGVVIALTALLASGPYVAALASFGPIADSARGMLSMNPDAGRGDTERRAGRLDDAGFAASSFAQTYLIIVGGLTALLVASALPFAVGRRDFAVAVDLAKPVVLWSGALGAAAVLGYAGSGLLSAARAARSVVLEVERQLRGFPRDRGMVDVPADYTPSYRACVDLSARVALERLGGPVALALFVPAALGVCIRLLYLSSDPGLPAEGLTSFVVVASVTGLSAALAVEAARATLGAARRASRPRGMSPGFAASVSGDALADLIGSSAGPAAQLLVRAVAVSALCVAPLVS